MFLIKCINNLQDKTLNYEKKFPNIQETLNKKVTTALCWLKYITTQIWIEACGFAVK